MTDIGQIPELYRANRYKLYISKKGEQQKSVPAKNICVYLNFNERLLCFRTIEIEAER
ncbi:MAG: hypothetical protein JWN60_2671 [Acidobacteria bacterium]|jgi:hypothetical protein|nr:hypothetical protein [Acidobacteriota bacterium]